MQTVDCFLCRSRFHRLAVFAFFILAFASLALAQDITAFVGVNVLPMDSERVIRGQTVIVRDARIAEMGEVATVVIPLEATIVYGRGRWLLPGLVDMHVHIRARDLERYVESGITTVRDLAGLDSVLTIAREISEGARTGPRIITSTHLLNGPNPASPTFSVVVSSASSADSIVAAELARGCQAVKLYENLQLPVYDALVAASRARGVKIAGHVSGFVSVDHAMVSQDSIEHLSGYERALEVYAEVVTPGMPPADRARVIENRRLFVADRSAADSSYRT